MANAYKASLVSGSKTLQALNDTNITTPSEGQVLTYDSVASKWVNADTQVDGNIAQGYVQTNSDKGVDAVIEALNEELSTTFEGKTIIKGWSGYSDFDNPVAAIAVTEGYHFRLFLTNSAVKLFGNDGSATIRLANDNDPELEAITPSNFYWSDSSTFLSLSSLQNIEISYTSGSSVTPGAVLSGYTHTIFVIGDVDITDYETPENIVVIDVDLDQYRTHFYEDSSLTQLITPYEHSLYIDIPTGNQYIWKESVFKRISTNFITELNDTFISSPENGQVLSYDESLSKWVNRGSSGGSLVRGKICFLEGNRLSHYIKYLSTLLGLTMTCPSEIEDLIIYDKTCGSIVVYDATYTTITKVIFYFYTQDTVPSGSFSVNQMANSARIWCDTSYTTNCYEMICNIDNETQSGAFTYTTPYNIYGNYGNSAIDYGIIIAGTDTILYNGSNPVRYIKNTVLSPNGTSELIGDISTIYLDNEKNLLAQYDGEQFLSVPYIPNDSVFATSAQIQAVADGTFT